jgi:PAT family beta-lactamase induction signal transducer AmpG
MLALWHKQTLPKGMEKMGLNDKYSIMQIGMKGEKRIKLSKLLLPFRDTLVTFFNKKGVVPAILFMILFRFPEAQLAKMAQPFMLRAMNEGGLGLATETVGLTYGTIGVISLLCGGLLGGYLVSLHGLKRWWWPMILAISLPDAVYIYLAIAQPISMYVINSCVAVEQFGYGLGFTAYTMFLVYFSRGERTTSVFSICTGLQALGMMLPGMLAG